MRGKRKARIKLEDVLIIVWMKIRIIRFRAAELAASPSCSPILHTCLNLLYSQQKPTFEEWFLFGCRLCDSGRPAAERVVLSANSPCQTFSSSVHQRLHEAIQLRNLKQDQEPVKSLLLDIDFRYAQFYSGEEFCHYNMFNHHFFDGRAASDVLDAFIREDDGKKVVMVADPPFGGLVKPLAGSFSLISQTWRAGQRWRAGHSSADGHTEMPMLWIFPYFFEPRILDCLPSFTMLDYQVDYDNHPLYKHGKSGRKQSPVRIFTNISAKTVVLPKEEGYRFCSACQRYVSPLNKHCARCNICPSKDGREWKHCPACEKCVKPSWKHCPLCSRCALPDHPCGPGPQREGCFGCGSLQHKRRTCPLKGGGGLSMTCPLKGGGGLSRPKVRRREKTFSALQKANRKWAAARGAKRAAAQTQ